MKIEIKANDQLTDTESAGIKRLSDEAFPPDGTNTFGPTPTITYWFGKPTRSSATSRSSTASARQAASRSTWAG